MTKVKEKDIKVFTEPVKTKEDIIIYNKTLHAAVIQKKKYKEMEELVYSLSEKVTGLTDKINEINKSLTAITILQEELLYTIEKSKHFNDKTVKLMVNTNEKKYEIN